MYARDHANRPQFQAEEYRDSDRLVCLEDGLWSFPEAYCKIECPEAPNIPSAKLLTADCLASGHDVGSFCRYRCSSGFYVVGSLKKKKPR
ncbi:hypothetical protein GOODEAATRI_020569 [Goodea atripinnis]|uniref:Sushi domain-containing protein n=1 Tax=Goodea atripinnis TaxID=208336 RepID=A0ABV0N3B3_9TELE